MRHASCQPVEKPKAETPTIATLVKLNYPATSPTHNSIRTCQFYHASLKSSYPVSVLERELGADKAARELFTPAHADIRVLP